jgi:hypothetical protein
VTTTYEVVHGLRQSLVGGEKLNLPLTVKVVLQVFAIGRVVGNISAELAGHVGHVYGPHF